MNGTEIGIDLFNNNALNVAAFAWFFAIVALLIVLFTGGSYLWQRYKKQLEFKMEMEALGLDPRQEGTLTSIVKRYRMQEPMSILLSEQLFDEMATREMIRILGSQASLETKDHYIRELYVIRERTYKRDLEEDSPSGMEQDQAKSAHANAH